MLSDSLVIHNFSTNLIKGLLQVSVGGPRLKVETQQIIYEPPKCP
jgi:hypothetical protein